MGYSDYGFCFAPDYSIGRGIFPAPTQRDVCTVCFIVQKIKIHIAFCVNVFLTFPKKMMISFALVDIYIFYPKILNDEHSLLEITLHSSFFEHFWSVIVLQSHNLPSFLHPSPPPPKHRARHYGLVSRATPICFAHFWQTSQAPPPRRTMRRRDPPPPPGRAKISCRLTDVVLVTVSLVSRGSWLLYIAWSSYFIFVDMIFVREKNLKKASCVLVCPKDFVLLKTDDLKMKCFLKHIISLDTDPENWNMNLRTSDQRSDRRLVS